MFVQIWGYLADYASHIGRVLSRAYITRQSAFAQALLFRKIAEIVKLDTGEDLKWRHLHSSSLDKHVGICLMIVDQHGGQAEGQWYRYVR